MAETRTSEESADKRSAGREAKLEDQIARLQEDLTSIAATLAALAEDKVSAVRSKAQREVRNLARSGQHTVEDVQDEFGQIERQIKDTIREKPLTAVAGAVAVGFLIAALTRR